MAHHKLSKEAQLERDKKIVQRFKEGLPASTIAQRFGYTTRKVYDALQRLGAYEPRPFRNDIFRAV